MSYYTKKIECILEELENQNSIPKYEPKKWQKFFSKPIYTNCYAYSLDLAISDKKQEIFIPGCIHDYNSETDIWSDVTSKVKQDLDFLNISYRDDDSTKLQPGEYRIAIYYIPSPHDLPIDFHFARQDENGEWSEKKGWDGPVQKIGIKGNLPPVYSKELYGIFCPILENVLVLKKH